MYGNLSGQLPKIYLDGAALFLFYSAGVNISLLLSLVDYLSVKNSGSSLYWLSRGLRYTAGAWLGRELGLNPILSFQSEYYRVSKKSSHFLNSWTIAFPLPVGCLNPLWKSNILTQIKQGFSKPEIQRVIFCGSACTLDIIL